MTEQNVIFLCIAGGWILFCIIGMISEKVKEK